MPAQFLQPVGCVHRSPTAFKTFFRDVGQGLLPFHTLTDRDFEVIFSTDAETLKDYDDLFDPLFVKPLAVAVDTVTRRLAYCPTGSLTKIQSAVQEGWKILRRINEYLADTSQRIHLAARQRGRKLTANDTRTGFFGWIIFWWMSSIEHLCRVHTLCKGVAHDLEDTALATIDVALLQVVPAIKALMVCRRAKKHLKLY